MCKFIEYKGPQRRLGIDDLKSIYAFHGNSQGDDSATNNVNEYLTSGGWKSVSSYFKDIDYLNQMEVDKRSKEILDGNLSRIEELKLSGNYGKLVDGITIYIAHDPLYDDVSVPNIEKPISYRYEILDIKK